MKTLLLGITDTEVSFLNEILADLGYTINDSQSFNNDTDQAVRDFQAKNNLVVDGIVGFNSWSKLIAADKAILLQNDKSLTEQDLIDFADNYGLELAAVKAVNEVESSGHGFFADGRPKILFEGHIFWQQLQQRNINPATLVNTSTQDVLYQNWTRTHYLGGTGEYSRLEKAASIIANIPVHEAAYCSASWGSFQIMGYHFKSLGYISIDSFVIAMYKNEANHLDAFGKFLKVNGLLNYLKNKDWAKFARGYNGSGYSQNQYDVKLLNAYNKYTV